MKSKSIHFSDKNNLNWKNFSNAEKVIIKWYYQFDCYTTIFYNTDTVPPINFIDIIKYYLDTNTLFPEQHYLEVYDMDLKKDITKHVSSFINYLSSSEVLHNDNFPQLYDVITKIKNKHIRKIRFTDNLLSEKIIEYNDEIDTHFIFS